MLYKDFDIFQDFRNERKDEVKKEMKAKQKYIEIVDNQPYRIVYEAYLYKLVKSKIRFVEQSKSVTFFCTRLLVAAICKLNSYKLIRRDRQVLVIETQYKSFISKFKTLAKHLAYYMKNKILTRFIEEHSITEPEIQEILKSVKNPDPIMKYIDLSDLVDPQAQEQFEEKHNPTERESIQLKEIADTDPTPKPKKVKELPKKLEEDLKKNREDEKEILNQEEIDLTIDKVLKQLAKDFKDSEVIETAKQIVSIYNRILNGDTTEIYNLISDFLRQKTIVLERPKYLSQLGVHKIFDVLARITYNVFQVMWYLYGVVVELSTTGSVSKDLLNKMSAILNVMQKYAIPQDTEIYETNLV